MGDGLSEKSHAIGGNLVSGVRDSLTDIKTRKQLENFIDSVLISLSSSLNPKISAIRDSLLNEKVHRWADTLLEHLTGERLKMNVNDIREAALGAQTREDLEKLGLSVNNLLNEILSDTLNNKIGRIRDQLLGAKTNDALRAIVDSAMSSIVYRINNDITPALQENVGFIQKNANKLLMAIGGIALAIIAYVWMQRRKYMKMVTLLASQIHNIPDEKVYNEVTAKIKDNALQTNLEPELNKILKKNDILGKEAWLKTQIKKRSISG